jgi:hypothetical protein
MRFEVFMVVKIQVEDFWVVTSCNVAIGYRSLEDLAAYTRWKSQPGRPRLEI